jgi:hypothetical protein
MKSVNDSIKRSLATAIPSLFIIESGVVKIIGIAPVVNELSKAGMGQFIVPLGITELVLAILFMVKRTLRLALIGLTCYFSGAIATEISHDGNGVFPLLLLVLVWISALIRDKYIFRMPVKKDNGYYGPRPMDFQE